MLLKDTLPSGWEFSKFSNGADYLIYKTTGAAQTGDGFPETGSLAASGNALASVDGLSAEFAAAGDPKTATFTFANLNKPYVILVKAKPTESTFDAYLKDADTRIVDNTLNLSSANWTPGKSVTRGVTVDSKVLEKTLDLSKQSEGILTWSVEYTPFSREIGTGLLDTLPQGIDLRTDSSGKLIYEQDGSRNITVWELKLKDDGSGKYEDLIELDLNVIKAQISYSGRKLTFNFPDKSKAYRLSYVTDITGMPGDVSNKVKLLGAEGPGTEKGESFEITEQCGMATMGRSAFLVVKKTNKLNTPLQNAEFTLYNTNADGSKGTQRAVRVTDAAGEVRFYGLAQGRYILVETKLPGAEGDYVDSKLEYSVVVHENLTTTVNGSTQITLSNPFTVVNYKSGDAIGSLVIKKFVAGNGADSLK